MPELAEVEFVRKRWDPGLGHPVNRVLLHPRAGVFKTTSPTLLSHHLPGATLISSEAAAKQMLFRLRAPTGTPLWLGLHLGMTGELSVHPPDHTPAKRDHLVLLQTDRALVFSDFRMFGRIQFHLGPDSPPWWANLAPPVLSPAFTLRAMTEFLHRRARSPLKAVLLMQERFPGIGNWMADEILWRAALHPARPAGSLSPFELRTLHRQTRWVCQHALRLIGQAQTPDWPDPPKSWLFQHRWQDGGRCPRTRAPLVRETIGGRTTCWSPARQKPPSPP